MQKTDNIIIAESEASFAYQTKLDPLDQTQDKN